MVRKKYNWKQILIFAGIVFLFFGNLTFYIWYQSESIRLGYKIHELEVKVEQLKEEIKSLEARKEALLSLKRVERIAREGLDLQDPKPEQIIFEDQISK
ncbi:MAG: cell division protein FtsL [Candidatus Saccharicenans sp.]|nr:MAG: cell division protein FtsL [Candidatus Aminicenantes bacterium]HEK84772.1 cell division protein FtsL [Candidatus Aminicenantes bacterium]